MQRDDPTWKEEHGHLHGFGAASFDPTLYYHWQDGRMHNGLVVVTFQLVDHPAGAGGLVMVPGSHKSNLGGPPGLYHFESDQDLVSQEVCHAGDVIIFTESLSHGTARWTAEHPRRSVLFRYAPANSAYAGGRHDFDREHRAELAWPAAWYEGLTDARRAVLEPPYHPRHERPILGTSQHRIHPKHLWYFLYKMLGRFNLICQDMLRASRGGEAMNDSHNVIRARAVCDRRRRRAARGEPAADRGKGLGGHWRQSIKQRSQPSAAKTQQTQAIGNGASLQGERCCLQYA
jgi:hypothetical protein